MLAAVKDLLRHRPLTGLAASLVLHMLVLALIFAGGLPAAQYTVKRGEPIMIELPELPESPPPGPRPVPSSPPPAKAPAARSAAPAPPAPRPPERATPAVAAKPAPPAPEGPLVASRTEPPRPTPEPEREPAGPGTTPPPPALSAPAPAAAPTPPRVAAIPPKRDDTDTVDIRSALRRGASGGAGGRGEARGGIEGEPIPLESTDPKYSDYLDHIRKRIKSNWGYPCVQDDRAGACEYKTVSLVVEFGIAKDGQVRFVNVVRASGWDIYDDWAVNAIKLSSPFLPVPDSLGKGTGIPILATFSYVVTTSITNLLH